MLSKLNKFSGWQIHSNTFPRESNVDEANCVDGIHLQKKGEFMNHLFICLILFLYLGYSSRSKYTWVSPEKREVFPIQPIPTLGITHSGLYAEPTPCWICSKSRRHPEDEWPLRWLEQGLFIWAFPWWPNHIEQSRHFVKNSISSVCIGDPVLFFWHSTANNTFRS